MPIDLEAEARWIRRATSEDDTARRLAAVLKKYVLGDKAPEITPLMEWYTYGDSVFPVGQLAVAEGLDVAAAYIIDQVDCYRELPQTIPITTKSLRQLMKFILKDFIEYTKQCVEREIDDDYTESDEERDQRNLDRARDLLKDLKTHVFKIPPGAGTARRASDPQWPEEKSRGLRKAKAQPGHP